MGAILLSRTPVPLRGMIFDVDGTLVDSNDLHTDCWVETFAHFGKRIARDVMRSQIGKGGDLLVPDLCNAREMQRFGEALKNYRSELYKEKYMPRVQPFPRVREEGSTSKHDAELSKPLPEIFRAALDQIGTAVETTMTVGDTPYDVLASHRAALPIAAVLSGGFGRELLSKAEWLFDGVEHLVREIDTIDEYFSE